MRINHDILKMLEKQRNSKKVVKTSKTRVFDALQEFAGLNSGITYSTIKDAYKSLTGGHCLSWHLYGNNGYFKYPGKDGRYLQKVAYGVYELRGKKVV